jgi:hypothetical protein
VVRAHGARLTIRLPGGDIPATVRVLRDVNGQAGVELFIHRNHITTDETMDVLSFDRSARKLRRAASLLYGGEDVGFSYGFNCNPGSPPTIVTHAFEQGLNGPRWTVDDVTYAWAGARLHRQSDSGQQPIAGAPPAGEVGVHC